MVRPENRLLYPFNETTTMDREQQRLKVIADLALLDATSIAVFEEATQMAAHLLDMPVCTLGILDQEREWLKSAIGLSRLGVMNEIATSRQIPRQDSFSVSIVNSHQALVIGDAATHPDFAHSALVHRYRIRSYLGVPLLNSAGYCLGTLAVMDLVPRTFTSRDIGCLELVARWSMSEFERDRLTHQQPADPPPQTLDQQPASVPRSAEEALPEQSRLNLMRVRLLTHLTQELRTPLTSVLGMTSVLHREVYGPLSDKQKEYLDIVYQSSQYLLSLVNEIVELGAPDTHGENLTLTSVDLEMLCQQVLNTLEQAASRREQQIRLSIEPGPRIWTLDKNKVRQILYHLIFSLVQSSNAGSVIRLHVSRKQQRLQLSIWVSNPWLGESLPLSDLYGLNETAENDNLRDREWQSDSSPSPHPAAMGSAPEKSPASLEASRDDLGLVLSRQLVEMHGGQISLQGSVEVGYRYVISLPQVTQAEMSS
ncbi:histidine kinase [Leptolyngbya sp. 'hensonii']|uniref:GAF domain-containing sensor histidine kinase n=1 Tax=Leptolyngbya sp. 'hensonii' TaxID=1922337 RepID=UPI00094FABF5|nr:GAF domain-containing sensor histidine kinase [Leptolyngbya sp. 'hensonii']OLP19466.1 histidine kinase [Leptolyngbya sp. 'hensonii']